jgi:demethylmenaquinone methyltransferase/2-methoxy-6-polyprenyl-1,4-benzoquinol methylase
MSKPKGQAQACRPRMSRSYYVPGEQRAAKVNELFAGIARRYDLLNDLQSLRLHRRWKRRLILLAGPRPGLRALDVCCGTGDLALALARWGAETVGLDFSEAMLEVAAARSGRGEGRRQKAEGRRQEAEGGGRRSEDLRFVRGDAQRLPFEDDSFDIVTVGYGLRNLASWEAGLGEMQRVARPGGRLAVLDFGKPDNPLWRGLYFGYLRLLVPLLGGAFGGSARAYAYIHQSLAHYPAQPVLALRMRQLGLAKVGVINLLGGVMAIHCAEKA